MVFLTAGIFINYTYQFKRNYIDINYGNITHLISYIIFFFGTYFLICTIISIFKKDFTLFKNGKIILKLSIGLLILVLDSSTRPFFKNLVEFFDINGNLLEWAFYTYASLNQFFWIGFVILLYRIFFDRDIESLYGLKIKNVNLRPYFLMLLIMLPLIVWASFQPDFMRMYPIYKVKPDLVGQEMPVWLAVGSFEISYAVRFIAVEIFFRGFLVIGMVRLIGNNAVLPMAVLYSFWHFGKPMMETISAFFGGYILGVIALRTGSIYGGIIVHMGIALMMEFAAYIQRYNII